MSAAVTAAGAAPRAPARIKARNSARCAETWARSGCSAERVATACWDWIDMFKISLPEGVATWPVGRGVTRGVSLGGGSQTKNPPPHDAPEGPVSLHPLRCLPAASAPCGASHLAREGRLAWARQSPCLDAGVDYSRVVAAVKVRTIRSCRRRACIRLRVARRTAPAAAHASARRRTQRKRGRAASRRSPATTTTGAHRSHESS